MMSILFLFKVASDGLFKKRPTIGHQQVMLVRKLCPDITVKDITFCSKMKVMTTHLNPWGTERSFQMILHFKSGGEQKKNSEKLKSSNPEALQCWECITHPPLDKKGEGGSIQPRRRSKNKKASFHENTAVEIETWCNMQTSHQRPWC